MSVVEVIESNRCMEGIGFEKKAGNSFSCKTAALSQHPACTSDSVRSLRSVDRRLNSPFCKEYPKAYACQPPGSPIPTDAELEMLERQRRIEWSRSHKYDHWICEEIWTIIVENKHQIVHCYLPMGDEINIYPLIERMLEAGITVVTPKALPRWQLQHLVLNSLDDLEKCVLGTRHPANSEVFTGAYDLIIVPGMAFDYQHYRLGYGGGYYDNFIVHHPDTYKLGICYPFQRMETIPLESHDVELEEILCKD